MATAKSGISKVGNNYYQSITQDNPDGSVGTTMYRVNADGSGGVPIYDVDKSAGSNDLVKSFDPNATQEEIAALSDPNSQLSQARAQQVTSSNPYSDAPNGATAQQQQDVAKAAGGSGNTASTAQEQTSQQASGAQSDAETKQIGENAQTSVERGPEPDEGKLYYYPLNRKNGNGGDFIHIEMRSYQKSGFQSAPGSFTITRMEDRLHKRIADVYLPIQSGIVDAISVDWGNGEIDPLTAQFANAAMGTMAVAATGDLGKAAETFGGKIYDIVNKVVKNNSEMQKLAINKFTQNAIGTPGLIGRSIGGAINNNLELLFNGPTLRSFTFNFKLTPREPDEAKMIKNIIRLFKRGMSPALSNSGLFLSAPNVFKIKYIYTGKGDKNDPHPYLNKIKVAALRDFSVNYTPDGNYMTYGKDGSMTSYDLSMTFGEIDPVFAQDYEDEQGKTGMGW